MYRHWGAVKTHPHCCSCHESYWHYTMRQYTHMKCKSGVDSLAVIWRQIRRSSITITIIAVRNNENKWERVGTKLQ